MIFDVYPIDGFSTDRDILTRFLRRPKDDSVSLCPLTDCGVVTTFVVTTIALVVTIEPIVVGNY